jgi:hypothetical protein
MNEDDFELYEEDVYASERAAGERVGEVHLAELLAGENKKVDKSTSPEDRFLIFTNAIARKMIADKIKYIAEGDVKIMLEKTRNIIGLRFKNPTAYIMGYIASSGGKEITKKNVDYVFSNVLPIFGQEAGVTEADVIRYARFWKEHL